MKRSIAKNIPWVPISALIFYLCCVMLWKVGVIPGPSEIFSFLENLYISYGLFGLFLGTFLEGIVYFGLYFPGSFIVALAVILSDGSFLSLFSISLVVALTLMLTSVVNYVFGVHIAQKRSKEIIKEIIHEEEKYIPKDPIFSKGIIAAMFHPTILAFYFFNAGLKRQSIFKLLLVPLVMIPYGLVLAYILYSFKEFVRVAVENPYLIITSVLIWLVIAWYIKLQRK